MYTVKDILELKGYNCYTVVPEDTVYNALKKMAGHNIGAVLVMYHEKVVGIFSEREYARKIVLMGNTSRDSKVGDFMSDRVYTVRLHSTINECMRIMTDQRVRHLPVLDDRDYLIGVVSIGDVVNKFMIEQNNTINQLEDYIVGKR